MEEEGGVEWRSGGLCIYIPKFLNKLFDLLRGAPLARILSVGRVFWCIVHHLLGVGALKVLFFPSFGTGARLLIVLQLLYQ